jgi:hypothetical protein
MTKSDLESQSDFGIPKTGERSKYKPVIPVFIMAKGGIGRRGQGLPLNVIVIAAIAIIVLVLVIAFATGALGKLFGGAKTFVDVATPEQVATFRISCEQACFAAQQLADSPEEWKASDYCDRTIKVNDTATNTILDKHCWESPVVSECSKQTEQFGTLDQTKCQT